MKHLSVVLVAGALVFAGCGGTGPHAQASRSPASPSPSRQYAKPFETMDPEASTTPAPTEAPSAPDPMEVARRDLYAANTLHYVFTFATADGQRLERETGTVQLQPFLLTYTRVVGSHSIELTATADDEWFREGTGCWTHHTNSGPGHAPPGPVTTVLYGLWRNASGRTLLVGAAVPRVVQPLGATAAEEFDIPTSGSRGLVEIRATVDRAGRFTGWTTTLSEVVAALEKVGAQPRDLIEKLDATLSTTFSHLGEPVAIAPPVANDVCAGVTA
jgi:hypothetical protein